MPLLVRRVGAKAARSEASGDAVQAAWCRMLSDALGATAGPDHERVRAGSAGPS